jgi:hypothetical protein
VGVPKTRFSKTVADKAHSLLRLLLRIRKKRPKNTKHFINDLRLAVFRFKHLCEPLCVLNMAI